MLPVLFPPSLPSLEQRRDAAASLLDPSGKGVHNGFRVPDQAVVWTGESSATMSSKTEESLYGGGYPLEMLPVLLLLMLAVVAAFVIFSGVGNSINE